MCPTLKKHIPCVAFACISLLFIASGISKIMNFDMMVGYVAMKNLPFPQLWIILAIIIELVGGLMVFFKCKAKMGACLLGVFLIVATLLFHVGEGELINFLKNLSIFGGLMLVCYLSCDSCCSKSDKKEGGGCCSSKKGDSGCC